MLITEYIQPGNLAFLLVIVQALLLYRLWQKSKRQNSLIEETKKELEVLLTCERNIANLIKSNQEKMHGIVERQDILENTDVSNVNYKQAIALLNKGASTSEMVETCDISRGELELITRLQQKKTPSLHSKVA